MDISRISSLLGSPNSPGVNTQTPSQLMSGVSDNISGNFKTMGGYFKNIGSGFKFLGNLFKGKGFKDSFAELKGNLKSNFKQIIEGRVQFIRSNIKLAPTIVAAVTGGAIPPKLTKQLSQASLSALDGALQKNMPAGYAGTGSPLYASLGQLSHQNSVNLTGGPDQAAMMFGGRQSGDLMSGLGQLGLQGSGINLADLQSLIGLS